VSFVTIYRKRCDRENGVQDVLPGSEFCVQYYLCTQSKKPKNRKN